MAKHTEEPNLQDVLGANPLGQQARSKDVLYCFTRLKGVFKINKNVNRIFKYVPAITVGHF